MEDKMANNQNTNYHPRIGYPGEKSTSYYRRPKKYVAEASRDIRRYMNRPLGWFGRERKRQERMINVGQLMGMMPSEMSREVYQKAFPFQLKGANDMNITLPNGKQIKVAGRLTGSLYRRSMKGRGFSDDPDINISPEEALLIDRRIRGEKAGKFGLIGLGAGALLAGGGFKGRALGALVGGALGRYSAGAISGDIASRKALGRKAYLSAKREAVSRKVEKALERY